MLTQEQMAEVVRPFSTVSDKIRALARHGVPRAEIARFLDRRYQHVRNVLEGDKTARAAPDIPQIPLAAVQGGVSDHAPAYEPRPGEVTERGGVYRFTVGADGSVKLPAQVLETLGIEPLTIAVAVFENDTFAFLSRREALRRARALIPQWRPGEPLWSDELIAERRREAAEEEKDV
jgi:hypothetical protein